jgi:hypothetical protein
MAITNRCPGAVPVEAGVPVCQNPNRPQPRQEWDLSVGWMHA